MDKRFTDWYQTIDPQGSEDRLKKRWASIEAFVKGSSSNSALDAVRLFYDLTPIDCDFTEKFSNYFFQKDKSFSQKNASKEIAVLAGVAAFISAERSEDLATYLAISNCLAVGAGPKPALDDLVKLSEEKLIHASKKLRTREVSQLSLKTPQKAINALKGDLGDHNQVKEQTGSALEIMIQQQKSIEQYCNALQELAELQKEELDIMWWLYGEYSQASGKYFSQLSAEDACLALAIDARDLTLNIPGPMAMKAFLKKAMESSKGKKTAKLSLKQLNNGSSDIIKGAFLESITPISGLTPISNCIKQYRLYGEGSEWHIMDSGRKVFLDADKELKTLDLAYQLYRESLLIHAVDLANEE